MKIFKRGFSLLEVMIVVAIIALLAAIAIPNLLRAKLSSNDALAKATVKAISTASESYANSNQGNYPVDIASLTEASPAYLNFTYCGQTISGYAYTCTFDPASYTVSATPVSVGKTGTTTYTMSTGGVLTPP